MIQYIFGNGEQFFPVVPFANGIFYFSQALDEFLFLGVLGHFQNIAEFLDLQTVGMQVIPSQMCRLGKLG